MNRLEETKKNRMRVAMLFGSVCYVCNKKFKKGLHFHHKKYYKNEKTINDFDGSASIKNWMDYQDYILPIIEKRPNDFALLCKKHHKLVEVLKKFKPERFENLVKIVRESRND